MTDLRVVMMTAPTQALARDIAAIAVREKLAACVNIVPGILSLYEWEGELTEDPEVLMIFKTTTSSFSALQARMLELHPYEVPEFVSLPADNGSAEYLSWVAAATGGA